MSFFGSSGGLSLNNTNNNINNNSPLNPSSSPSSLSSQSPELANDTTLNDPPTDGISDIAFSPTADLLAVASWDNSVRLYEVVNGQSQGRAMYTHEAPVLSARWSPDGSKVASAGCDNAVRVYDVASNAASSAASSSNASTQIGAHDAPIRALRWVEMGPAGSGNTMLATASWDRTLKYWDLRSPQAVATVTLPERAYSMDTSKSLLVAATAERHVVIIDLNNPQNIFRTSVSPLKMQTRVVACFPSGDGFALTSIEGRCSIQYVDPEVNKQNTFSFKCHRRPATTAGPGSSSLNTTIVEANARAETLVYSVNSVCFHPVYGTMCTAGADGTFHFWDKDNKHRLKGFNDVGGPITATAFNASGNVFAYSISYDWSKGYQYAGQGINTVKFHPVAEDEVKQRTKLKR